MKECLARCQTFPRRPQMTQAPTGRSAGDHMCWPFREQGELAAVAGAFVAEGLGRDESPMSARGGRASCETTWPGSRTCRTASTVASGR